MTQYASNAEILNTRIRNYLYISNLNDRIQNKRINYKRHVETLERERISEQWTTHLEEEGPLDIRSYVGRTYMFKVEWNGSKGPNLDIALSRMV